MGSNLINSWSVRPIVAEHFDDQILEFTRKTLTTSLLPVGVEVSIKDELVEVFFLLGLFEGEDSLDDNEKNNSC